MVQLTWPEQKKLDALKVLLGLGLTGVTVGAGSRLAHEALAAPVPQARPLRGHQPAEARRQFLGPATKQAEAPTVPQTSSVPGFLQSLLKYVPGVGATRPVNESWVLAAGIPLGLAGTVGGWRTADAGLDQMRLRRLQNETERAKQDYGQLFQEYYQQALDKHAADLAEVATAVEAKPEATKQAGWDGTRAALGLYLAALASTGYLGYNRGMSTISKQRAQATRDVTRARRLQARDRRDPLPLSFLDTPAG